jgi:integrase
MSKQKFPGLYYDKESKVWSIDKRIDGRRIRSRFTAASRAEAERIYLETITGTVHGGTGILGSVQVGPTFRQAAAKYVRETEKKSMERDIRALQLIVPVLGDLPLERVHDGTVQIYVQKRRHAGARSQTIIRELAVLSRILKLCARVWRDRNDKPWLSCNPLLERPKLNDGRKPYPLIFDEQRRLFRELPRHLAEMALFAVNTGCRESIVTGLRWDWEVKVPELGTSVFLVPGDNTKSGKDQLIVLNDVARSVIDARRAGRIAGSPFVFCSSNGRPWCRLHSHGWSAAWIRAGLPGKDSGYLRGVHNLRHTFARRLRAVGVPMHTIKTLMHHSSGDVTERYSVAGLQELIDAVQRLKEAENVTMLRVAV